MKTPFGEIDIPFVQNPFTNKNQGAVPILQNPFNYKKGVSAGVFPENVSPAPASKGKSPQAAPQQITGGDVAAAGGGGGYGYGAGGGGIDMNAVNSTRGSIKATIPELMAAFDQLFGNLHAVAADREAQTRKDYGDQFGTAAKQYTDSIPKIENSYAAIGADSSTDNTYAKNDAKEGYDNTNKQIQKNEDDDLAKIGNYLAENTAKYSADRDSVNRLAGRVDQTTDIGDLNNTRNAIEDKLGSVRADTGALNTDAGARGQLSALTADNGRFDSLKGALDQIINGSMSGAVKQAAVQSVVDAGGLSDEDKKKVQAQYGNAYNTPVAA